MRTLTYQEMTFVSGAKQGEKPPQIADLTISPAQSFEFLLVCAANVKRAKKQPTFTNVGIAASTCNTALQTGLPLFLEHLNEMPPAKNPNPTPHFWR